MRTIILLTCLLLTACAGHSDRDDDTGNPFAPVEQPEDNKGDTGDGGTQPDWCTRDMPPSLCGVSCPVGQVADADGVCIDEPVAVETHA